MPPLAPAMRAVWPDWVMGSSQRVWVRWAWGGKGSLGSGCGGAGLGWRDAAVQSVGDGW